jgi:diacylglycerol kinase (ATP)
MKNKTDRFTISSRLRSFNYAFHGLASAFRQEHNLWIHTLAAIAAITMGCILKISAGEWMVIILVIGGVFVAELLNAAIESLVDLISPAFNKKAGTIKDMAAAAVLMTAIVALVTGLIIFVPKLL